MAMDAVAKHQFSASRACRLFCISKTTYNYIRKLDDNNHLITKLLLEITEEHRTWGFQLCYLHIRNVLGFIFNHKRVYRIYS